MKYMMKEEWRPVKWYEDLYEVSNTGRDRSKDFIIIESIGMMMLFISF